jgi:hypothetical protein
MPLDTDLNVQPYVDDFSESKNFHRVLFKPATAVQARELNQIQSILQNQIERFGNAIYKDGSIIKDCGVISYPDLPYVRINDQDISNLTINVEAFEGTIVESDTTGLRAQVLAVEQGTTISYPDTNRVYLKYINTGSASNTEYKVFQPNETLSFYQSPISDNVYIASVNTYANTANNTLSAGKAVAVGVSSGIVYQKGFFIRVDEQILVLADSPDPAAVGNTCVGFQTLETFVNSDIDTSLLDNALGYENENAPGADRLKLTATLTSFSSNSVANATNYAIIAQYVNGRLVEQTDDPNYSRVGDELARREFETAGSFVVRPFNVDTATHSSNTQLLTASVSPGSGYASGYRVELLKTAEVDIRRGIDVSSSNNQIITTNYGSYVYVQECAGTIDFSNVEEVEIWDTAQTAVTNKNFSALSPSGSKIGVANVRSTLYSSGTPGTPTAQYAVYLFNIRMNSGKSFSVDGKSLYFNSTNKGVADIILSGGLAVLQNSERRSMLWGFGRRALKNLKDSANNIHTNYVFRQKTTSTLNANGIISLTLTTAHAGGTNQFPYGNGIVGDGNENRFTVVALANTATANLAGTVSVSTSSNVVTGTSTSLSSMFSNGDYVKIGNDIRRVTSTTSATVMQVDSVFSVTNAAANYVRYIPQGYRFPFSDTMVGTRNITIVGSTSATINTGVAVAGTLTGAVSVAVYHDVYRVNTVPAKKSITKTAFVAIDTSNNAGGNTGPWSLGLPDVHRIEAVYVGNTYSVSNQNRLSNFMFDNGQKDTHYDLAFLAAKPGVSYANTKILVQLSAFTQNTTPGVGFFTVESYPIDDANTANTTATTTARIGTYQTETGSVVNLRDVVDFRPYVANTAALTTTAGSATINPAATTNVFSLDAVGTYVPSPDQNFISDITYYIGRKDIVYFTNSGFLKVKEGIASDNARTPLEPEEGMSIAVLDIPPYPSLTANEQPSLTAVNRTSSKQIRDTSLLTSVSIVTNRRYTMRDIGVLDKRLSALEYYQSLSLLEKAATDLNIPDVNGLDRFKNGIFVDPFTSFAFSDVRNTEYRIAIDADRGIARPYFTREVIDTSYANTISSGVVKTGRVISLPYTQVVTAEQPFATKYRSAAPAVWRWNGTLKLFPTYDMNVDKVNDAAVQVTIDLASPWQDFANSPFGTQYGDWRTVAQTSQVTAAWAEQSTDWAGGVGTATYTTTSTTTTQARTIQKLNADTSMTTYNLGSFVEDISVQPYMRSREIGFHAWGLRPNITVHAFFDEVNVDTSVAPGTKSVSIVDTTDDRYVTRANSWGTALKTDSNGELWGKFLIPAGQFRIGERNFKLADTNNLKTGNTATTTTAAATFVASNITTKNKSITLKTINPELRTTSSQEQYSSTTYDTTVSQSYQAPPPATTPASPNYPACRVADDDAFSTSLINRALNSDEKAALRSGVGWINLGNEYMVSCDSAYNAYGIGLPGYPYFPDPLSQGFRISDPNAENGMFISGVDLYFEQKSLNASHGVTVSVCELVNGFPDATKILPFSRCHLNYADINVSADGTTVTNFTFEAPVYIANNKQYAFIIEPDGSDPDYRVWMAALGDADVKTGIQAFKMPYSDPAYYSANKNVWTALQDEYVKFKLYRANFTISTGTAYFPNDPCDYLTVNNITYPNNSVGVITGDWVYASINSTANTIDANSYGRIKSVDTANGIIHLDNTTGTFVNAVANGFNNIIIQRFAGDTQSNGTVIASANLVSIDNPILNAVVPRFAQIVPSSTTLDLSYRGTNNTYTVDTSFTNTTPETETELYDYERRVVSTSNERAQSIANTVMMKAVLSTRSSYVSPIIDTVRTNILAIGNLVDPTTANTYNEYFNYGNIKSKYVSQTVVLADGQDAEDLKIYLTAYRPPGADIVAYAKFLNYEDNESITQKPWTKLTSDMASVYSDYKNTTDYKEYRFSVPNTAVTLSGSLTTAYVPDANGITYTSASGQKYSRYKQVKIKIIVLADSSATVPRLNDSRGICLQL